MLHQSSLLLYLQFDCSFIFYFSKFRLNDSVFKMTDLTIKFSVIKVLLVVNSSPIFSAPCAPILLFCGRVRFLTNYRKTNLTPKFNSVRECIMFPRSKSNPIISKTTYLLKKNLWKLSKRLDCFNQWCNACGRLQNRAFALPGRMISGTSDKH